MRGRMLLWESFHVYIFHCLWFKPTVLFGTLHQQLGWVETLQSAALSLSRY